MTATLTETTETKTTPAMALTVKVPELVKALKTVGRVVPVKHSLYVLTCLHLEAKDDQLWLTANNLEQIVRLPIAAEVAGVGAICLPAKLFTDFVDSLDGGELTIRQEPAKARVELACGRYQAHLSGISAEDFPKVPEVSAALHFELPAKRLKLALTQTAIAIATDDTRPVLGSLLFRVDHDLMRLTLAGADGFRLATRDVPLSGRGSTPEAPTSVLVPRQSVRELLSLLPDSDVEVRFAVPADGRWLRATWTELEVISILVNGEFPDYQRIIPGETPTRVVAPVAELLAAIKTAAVFSRDNSNIVRLAAEPSEDGMESRLQVDSSSAELGDQHSELDVSIEGEASNAAFNGRYLRDALEAIDGEEVALCLSGPTTPVKIEPVGGTPQMHIVMPMHVAR